MVALTSYGQLILKARSIAHAADIQPEGDRLAYLALMFRDGGLAAAVLASVSWMLAIERTELAFAYPSMALSFVAVPLGSAMLFRERLAGLQLAGALAIVGGVALSAASR